MVHRSPTCLWFGAAKNDKLTPLFLYYSSNDPDERTTLRQYVERMVDDQEEIYYVTGESREIVANSPHLEAFKKKGVEVLYLVDPIDEFLVQALTEFDGKKLKSVTKGDAAKAIPSKSTRNSRTRPRSTRASF